ncbi:hypothetical protein Cgig2_016170 [Carnegiea gigantea]|uniref:60S ribosomal export protein NMD3 n=1 Tax=Carnegiea gigantea TaxID=171969 RepID=A0A9Q1KPS7_9CARY|nr:hypothetical protein Cgig2_016170 [Carnegiea gigantea]
MLRFRVQPSGGLPTGRLGDQRRAVWLGGYFARWPMGRSASCDRARVWESKRSKASREGWRLESPLRAEEPEKRVSMDTPTSFINPPLIRNNLKGEDLPQKGMTNSKGDANKHLRDNRSYFQPPTTWVKAPLESKELLAVCLKKVKKLSEFRLVNAEFICTDPNSKRIQVKVKVQREVLDGVFVEEQHTIESVVFCQNCTSCTPNDPNQWEAVVQVRQHVSHMRTFYYLEQVIRKHQAHIGATKIKPINQGIDFFFAKKSDATKFYDFLGRVVPIKQARFHKELVSQDIKSNICRYRFNIAATICPICHDDLIYLPPKLSSSVGYLGPLVICTKVRNTITLLNPFTLQKYVLRRDQYWRAPFESILSSMQLVEYIVLDVKIDFCRAKEGHKKYASAEVQIARVSDFGRNDTIFCVKTHLGHLLKPGDCALGYDLHGANLDTEVEKYIASLPDAVLIKKKYGSKQQNKV